MQREEGTKACGKALVPQSASQRAISGEGKVIGQMIGTLFLRSYQRGERVYLAMVSRGFDGRAVSLGRTQLRPADYLVIAGAVSLFLFLRITLR